MRKTDDNVELLQLLDALCDEQLTGEQFSRLQQLLRGDQAAQQMYLDYVDLHLGLKRVVAAQSDGAVPVTAPDATRSAAGDKKTGNRKFVAVAAGLLIAAGAVVTAFVLKSSPVSTSKKPRTNYSAPQLLRLTGDVKVHSVAGTVRDGAVGMELRGGERIETSESGVAVMGYDDGTRLTLVNRCSVTADVEQPKSMLLHYGIVSAEVATQPPGRSMLLTTPEAQVEVLGTRFAISATQQRTELNVSEGRVRLTRVSDGQTVDVSQGQGVVASGEARLEVHRAPSLSGVWGVDFETGVAPGWTGRLVSVGLPRNSTYAMRPISPQENETYAIATGDRWVRGLFNIHADSHLHITLKMEHPNWLNVFFSSRDSDPTRPTWTLHNFNEIPFLQCEPGEWQTVTIPLSKFRSKRDGIFHDKPPATGTVAYSLAITFTGPDRGLVVDRIWLTRGGPGKVALKPLR